MKSFALFFLCIIWLSMPSYGQIKSVSIPEQNIILSELSKQSMDSVLSWMKINIRESVDRYHPIAFMALRRAYAEGSDSTIAKVHSEIAGWHSWNGFFSADSVLYHSKKTLYWYQKLGDGEMIAKTLKSLAIDYYNTGDFQKSQQVLFEALAAFEANEDEQGVAGCYRILAAFHEQMEEPEKSIEYADKAIPLFKKVQDHTSIAITYFNYIKSYKALKQYDKAIEAATYCIELATTKAPEEVFVPIRAYGHRHEVYDEMGEHELALADATKAWEMAVKEIGEERAGMYRAEVGASLLNLNRPEEALPHLQTALAIYEERQFPNIWKPLTDLANAYQSTGNYELALNYFQKARSLKETMLNEKVENLKSEAVIKYETGKKDEALAQQEQQLLLQSKIQYLIIAIAGLFAILLFALYANYRKNKKATAKLESKNKENELLLKEIHHRVKNNLQTVSSLLSLQSESISDPKALNAVQESKNRVASMALLHQRLYTGENLAAVEMADYFENIGKTVIESFGQKAENVSLEVQMEPLELDVDTAVPVGLITNELMTNSLKYAFLNENNPKIEIKLTQGANNMLVLQVADNGQGDAKGNQNTKETGFGSMLINLLTTQLGGQMKKTIKGGRTTIIEFPRQEKAVA